ncbi:hypothetical protein EV126DRAFT_412905 [Verticillium dahliae]|nr:hypothetical protein EV126DRAFT_412905 [Verticillium dahliae]
MAAEQKHDICQLLALQANGSSIESCRFRHDDVSALGTRLARRFDHIKTASTSHQHLFGVNKLYDSLYPEGKLKPRLFMQLLRKSAGKCDWSCCPKPDQTNVEAEVVVTNEAKGAGIETSFLKDGPSQSPGDLAAKALKDNTTAQRDLIRARMKNLATAWDVSYERVFEDLGSITENCSRIIHRLGQWSREAVLKRLPPPGRKGYKPADFKRVCEILGAQDVQGSFGNLIVLDPPGASPDGSACTGSTKRALQNSPRCPTDGLTKRRRTSPPSLHDSQVAEVFHRLGLLAGIEVLTRDEIPPGPSPNAASVVLIPIRVRSRYVLGHVSGDMACAYSFDPDDVESCHARIRAFYDKRSNGSSSRPICRPWPLHSCPEGSDVPVLVVAFCIATKVPIESTSGAVDVEFWQTAFMHLLGPVSDEIREEWRKGIETVDTTTLPPQASFKDIQCWLERLSDRISAVHRSVVLAERVFLRLDSSGDSASDVAQVLQFISWAKGLVETAIFWRIVVPTEWE